MRILITHPLETIVILESMIMILFSSFLTIIIALVLASLLYGYHHECSSFRMALKLFPLHIHRYHTLYIYSSDYDNLSLPLASFDVEPYNFCYLTENLGYKPWIKFYFRCFSTLISQKYHQTPKTINNIPCDLPQYPQIIGIKDTTLYPTVYIMKA